MRTGSGWQRWRRRLWSRDGGDGGKHDSYRGGEGGGGPRTLQVPGELLPGTLGLMTLMGLSLSKGAPRKRRAGTRGGGGGRVRGYKKRRLTLTLHRAEGKSTEPELPTEPRLATRVSFTSAASVRKRHAARRCPGPPHLPQVRPAFIMNCKRLKTTIFVTVKINRCWSLQQSMCLH